MTFVPFATLSQVRSNLKIALYSYIYLAFLPTPIYWLLLILNDPKFLEEITWEWWGLWKQAHNHKWISKQTCFPRGVCQCTRAAENLNFQAAALLKKIHVCPQVPSPSEHSTSVTAFACAHLCEPTTSEAAESQCQPFQRQGDSIRIHNTTGRAGIKRPSHSESHDFF